MEDHAYLAGIIDGEGTIALTKLHKNDRFRSPVVSVANTSFELLEYLKNTYKGSICIKKKYKEHHKLSGTWYVSYNNAILILSYIKPFLKIPSKIYRCNIILNEYKKLTLPNGKYSEKDILLKQNLEFKFFHPSIP